MRNVRYLFSKLQIHLRSFRPINSARFNSNFVNDDDEEKIIVDGGQYKFEKSINEVKLLGRVGKGPVVFEKNGKPFVQFHIATNRVQYDIHTGVIPPVDWHTIFTCNSKLLEYVSACVRRGKRVYVSGKLCYIKDIEAGEKIAAIMLHNIILLS